MAYTIFEIHSQFLSDQSVAAVRNRELYYGGKIGNVAFPIELSIQSGSGAAIQLSQYRLFVIKAVVTHKGAGSNLLIGRYGQGFFTLEASSRFCQTGIEIFPGQSYTFEPGNGLRFDLFELACRDSDGLVQHDVHILGWL